MIQYIDVHAVLRQSSAGEYGDLVTRSTGRRVRERIEQAINAGAPPVIARMDFSGVGCVDYSCADEIVAKLSRAWGPPTVVVLRGLTESHREAIEPVLASHRLAVVLETSEGALHALGEPSVGTALLEQLVALRFATRQPGGTLALNAT